MSATHRQLPLLDLLQRCPVWAAFPVGAALALAFAPFGWWPLAILCQCVLFLWWQDAEPRQAAGVGFWFTSGTFLAGTYWIYHAVHVIGHAPLWIALFLMVGLCAIMGGYSALVGYLQARFLPQRGAWRWMFGLPAAWVLLEWFRGWFLSGFPWLSLGYSQIDSPLSGYAPVLGVYGVSWMVALVAGALVGVVHATGRTRWLHLAVAALPWLIAWPLWQREWTQPVDEPVSVAIVQGAVPQDEKWSVEQRDRTLALYRHLAEPHFGRQIILWPEAALPDLAHQLTDYLGPLWRDARAAGTEMVMGLLHYEPATDGVYNGVLALTDRVQWYDKRRLVPFGEFFPVPSFVREWLRLMSLPYSDISPGSPDQPALDVAGQKLGITICYEDSYGEQQLGVLKDATLLVNVTNDAWFGDSSGPQLHMEISRMRALESGRMLLRAANDGVSAIIGADGKVVDTLPRFKAAVLTSMVQPRTGLTPYAKVGNWPVVILCTVLVIVALLRQRRWHASIRKT